MVIEFRPPEILFRGRLRHYKTHEVRELGRLDPYRDVDPAPHQSSSRESLDLTHYWSVQFNFPLGHPPPLLFQTDLRYWFYIKPKRDEYYTETYGAREVTCEFFLPNIFFK